MSKLYLITDCWGLAQFNLCEGKEQASGRVTFRGPYTESDSQNRNRRIYPERVMRPEFDRLAVIAERSGLLGELDHPQDSTIHLERASHKINKLWWDKPKVGYGEATTLPTPAGFVLEALFHENVPVGISSRGVGQGYNKEGVTIIEEGFKLITFDTVADPSYADAWQNIREGVLDDIQKGRVRVYMPSDSMKENTYQGFVPMASGQNVTTKLESLKDTIDRADKSHAKFGSESASGPQNGVIGDDLDSFLADFASLTVGFARESLNEAIHTPN
jgi:hypothetical protein